jgi:hypothetical protein
VTDDDLELLLSSRWEETLRFQAELDLLVNGQAQLTIFHVVHESLLVHDYYF